MIKLLIGGSPCTHWSIAQSKNRETTAEGQGWELFRNYLIAREKFQPDLFLYENNKSAAPGIKDQIAAELGAPLQYINSALVSAQRRERFYVHNFGDVPAPADRGILLQHVLESGTAHKEKAYTLRASAGTKQGQCNIIKHITTNGQFGYMGALEAVRIGTIESEVKNADFDSQQYRVYSPYGKSVTICGQGGGVGAKTGLYATPCDEAGGAITGSIRVGYLPNAKGELNDVQSKRIYSIEGKAVPIQAAATAGGCSDTSSSRTGLYSIPCDDEKDAGGRTIYAVNGGLITIKDRQYPINLPDGHYIVRKLTVTECCRLQTLPDDYCRAVSPTQAYKGLGNGWTAEVIIHLLQHALEGVDRGEEIIVLSMYDGIGTGRYCLDQLGFRNVSYHAYEIDKYAIQIAQSNYPDIEQHGDAFAVRADNWEAPAAPENRKEKSA